MARVTLKQRVDVLERNAGELGEFREETRREFAAVRAELRDLRVEVRAGNEETCRYMRMLYEDLVERIATINGAADPRRSGTA